MGMSVTGVIASYLQDNNQSLLFLVLSEENTYMSICIQVCVYKIYINGFEIFFIYA